MRSFCPPPYKNKRKKGQKFGRDLSEKTELHTLCYRMYYSLGDSLLADKPAKQILLGSGKAEYPPSHI